MKKYMRVPEGGLWRVDEGRGGGPKVLRVGLYLPPLPDNVPDEPGDQFNQFLLAYTRSLKSTFWQSDMKTRVCL